MKKALLLLATMFLAACGTGGGEGTQTGTLKLNITESTAKTVELATGPTGVPAATYARLVISNSAGKLLKSIITDVSTAAIGTQSFQLPIGNGYTIDVISYYKVGTGNNVKNRLRKHGKSAVFEIIAGSNKSVDVNMNELNPQLAFMPYSSTSPTVVFHTPRAAVTKLFASALPSLTDFKTEFSNTPRAFYNLTTVLPTSEPARSAAIAPLRSKFGFAARTTGVYGNNTSFAPTSALIDKTHYRMQQSPQTNAEVTLYGRGEFYLKEEYLTDAEKASYKNWVYIYPYKGSDDPGFYVPVKVNGFTLNPIGGQ